MHRNLLAAAPLLLALSATALAQDSAMRSAPVATPVPRTVPDAVDAPYPGGTVTLAVDATDVRRGVYRVTQTIPVAPGTRRLTMLYPQWLPGNHAPRGPLAEVVDLRFTAGGRALRWERDPVEVYAFHVDLPENAREVVATFLHTSPLQPSEGRVTMTDEMLNLQWEKMSLYPAGHYVRQIRVRPSVRLPAGWTAAVALDGARRDGETLRWAETDYETLVDSPIFAGQHFRQWDLGNRVTLNVVADEPRLLDARPEHIATLRALVDEALIAFGSRHFDRYEFLVALTDRMGGIGLEHHRSSENQLEPENFIKWAEYDWDRNVLAHELAHSWIGKFRRPEGIWTPDFREPMRDNLLWVYEGQNQFWGLVLAARSGSQSKETVLGMLATQAGSYSEMPGREWRSVEDTTHDPIFGARKPKPYLTLARSEDYYNEGALVWLEADQIIRAGTTGRRGLDDFARAFFGIRDGDWGQVTFNFDDVVAGLNAVHPHDWATFLRTRLQTPGQPAPLGGIERAGYRLVWREEPNAFDRARFAHGKVLSLHHSLGITLDKDGKVTATRWGSPAFDAGLVTGAKIVAADGRAYSAEAMRDAVAAAKGGNRPVELIVQRGDRFLTVPVRWNGGLRYPWLEPKASDEQPLDRLLAPRRARR